MLDNTQVINNFKNYYAYKNTEEGRQAAATSSTAITVIAYLSSAAQASVFGPAAIDGVMGSSILNLPNTAYSRGFAYFSAFDSMGSNFLLGVACTEAFINRIVDNVKGLVCQQEDLQEWEYDLMVQTSGFQNAIRVISEIGVLCLATTASLPFLCLPVFGNGTLDVDPNATIPQQFLNAFASVPGEVLGLGIFQFITTIPVMGTGLFELKDMAANALSRALMNDDHYRTELIREAIVASLKSIRKDIGPNSSSLETLNKIVTQNDDPIEILKQLLAFQAQQNNVQTEDVMDMLAQNSRHPVAKMMHWLADFKAYPKRLYLAAAYTVCISSLIGYAHLAANLLAFGSMAMYCSVFAMVFIPLAGLTMKSTGPVAMGLLNACIDVLNSIYDTIATAYNDGLRAAFKDISFASIQQKVIDNKALLFTLLLTVACGFPNLHVNEMFMNPANYTGIQNAIAWFLCGTALVSAPAVNGYYGYKVMQGLVEEDEEEVLKKQDPVTAETLIETRRRLDVLTDYVAKVQTEKLEVVTDHMQAESHTSRAAKTSLLNVYARAGLSLKQADHVFFKNTNYDFTKDKGLTHDQRLGAALCA